MIDKKKWTYRNGEWTYESQRHNLGFILPKVM